MKRRAFLQSSAAYFTALQAGSLLLGNCQAVLAAPQVSRRALLIGVDAYSQDPLKGCTTDVELQAQLLTQRFGFAPENIIRLTNQAADLSGIQQVFSNQLSQLQPTELLLIHFSGKGSVTPSQQPALTLYGDDVLSLVDLAQLLNHCGSRQIITVLDTCYQSDGSSLAGNLRVRATVAPSQSHPLDIANVGLPGLVLSASTVAQLAVEVDYPDFSAGQFTYDLTQALWQTQAKNSLTAITTGTVNGTKSDQKLLDTLINTSVMQPSIGAITEVDTNNVTGNVWLGGLPATQIAAINALSLFTTADGQSLQVLGRQGLSANVRLERSDENQPLPLGQSLSEQQRTIPRDLTIQIAIDHSLSKIERVDAVGAFSSFANVNTKLIGEGAADYILAKVQNPDPTSNLVAAMPDAPIKDIVSPPQYTLFTADNQRISTPIGEAGEAVKTMVKRFAPVVETLYARKVLGLLENRQAAQLAISVEGTRLLSQAKFLFRQSTRTAQAKDTDMKSLPQLKAGTQLSYRVTNQSDTPLYWALFGWNSRHEPYLVLPPETNEASVLNNGSSTDLALRESSNIWSVRGPSGASTVYLITSDRPFSQTTAALQALQPTASENYLHALTQPLDIVQALLKDLSTPGLESSDLYGFDMTHYAVIAWEYVIA